MYAVKITNVWSGSSYLYPTIFESEEVAEKANIPQRTKNNRLEVLPLGNSKKKVIPIMYTVSNLNDKLNVHFRHPIPNVLSSKGIKTVAEMIALSDKEFKTIRNFGVAAMKKVEIFRAIAKTNNVPDHR